MSENKKKYTSLGTVMVAKKKDANDENEKPRFYLKLEQQRDKEGKPYGDVVFPIKLANGAVLKEGDILSMFSKKEKFQKAVDEGRMSQDKADELSAFLRFDVVHVSDAGAEPTKSKKDEMDF